MAYSFQLKGDSFDQKAWVEDIRETYFGYSGETVHPLSSFCTQTIDLDEDWDEGHLWLHPVDGIRGVTVRCEEEGIRLNLPAGSSKADFGLAWELLRFGLRHGAKASCDDRDTLEGSDQEIAELTPGAWNFLWSAIIQASGGQAFTLPVGGRLNLQVQESDTRGGPAALEAILLERMSRYCRAYVANLMQMTKDGKTQFCSIYSQIPTLIDSRSEMIALGGDNLPRGIEPMDAQKFYALVGAEVEDLGPMIYLPEVSTSLLLSIVAAEGGDPMPSNSSPGSPPPPVVPTENSLIAEDWAKLAKAPCLIFLLVAAADGSIDKKEVMAFGKLLRQQTNFPAPIVAKIVNITRNNVEAMLTEMIQNQINPGTGIVELMVIMYSGKIPQSDARAIGTYLYGLGEAIASASGGFLGFGSKISKEEAEILSALKGLLLP